MTDTQKIVIATHNISKFKEIKQGLLKYAKKKFEILSLDDLMISDAPDETGATFEENARMKALFYANLAHLPVITDDGGLIIDALHGEPGVLSNRWLGREATGQELINHALQRLEGIEYEKRRARFESILIYFDPQTKKEIVISTSIQGYISEKQIEVNGLDGYPFRKIFIIDKLNKYYAQLSDEEHARVNHRLKGLRKLVSQL